MKKKLQSVVLENEKMLRAMQRQGLEVSQESVEGGGSFEGRHRLSSVEETPSKKTFIKTKPLITEENHFNTDELQNNESQMVDDFVS